MLVPIPWQPTLYVHADLLSRLQAVEARLGRVPYLYGPNSGWRSYAQQKALWDAYQNGTGNVASNPDTGNRTHMRGVAADLQDTTLTMQAACLAVGLQRDPAEAWHWQLSNWKNYPIIPVMPPTGDAAKKEQPVTLYYCTKTDKPSTADAPQPIEAWGIGGDSPGTSANWIRTTDPAFARAAAAQHGATGNNWVFLTRAKFQEMGQRYLEPVKVASVVAAVDVAAIAQAVNDDAARRMAS